MHSFSKLPAKVLQKFELSKNNLEKCEKKARVIKKRARACVYHFFIVTLQQILEILCLTL